MLDLTPYVRDGRLRFKQVIFSDTHLFANARRSNPIRGMVEFLQLVSCDGLYGDGDIWDVWKRRTGYDRPLSEMEIRLQNAINAQAARGTDTKITEGNHEVDHRRGEDNMFVELVGSTSPFQNMCFAQSYDLIDPAGRRIFVTHGDKYDPPISRRLYKVGSHAYETLAGIDAGLDPLVSLMSEDRQKYFKAAYWGKRATKGTYISHYKKNALRDLPEGYDGLAIGHIHMPEVEELYTEAGRKVLYINSGDGTQSCSAAVCTDDGEWLSINWLEDRKSVAAALGLNGLPHERTEEPAEFAAQRSLTLEQIDVIKTTFPALRPRRPAVEDLAEKERLAAASLACSYPISPAATRPPATMSLLTAPGPAPTSKASFTKTAEDKPVSDDIAETGQQGGISLGEDTVAPVR